MQFCSRSEIPTTFGRAPLDPNQRRAIYGPVHSMDERPGLLWRLFGFRHNSH